MVQEYRYDSERSRTPKFEGKKKYSPLLAWKPNLTETDNGSDLTLAEQQKEDISQAMSQSTNSTRELTD